jgi:hypothetical protein
VTMGTGVLLVAILHQKRVDNCRLRGGTSLSYTAQLDEHKRLSFGTWTRFVLTAQGGYNYVSPEERCSVTSNVRLRVD